MIKRKRLVALFDILGFGTRLKSDSLGLVRRHLRQFIRTIRSQALTNSSINVEPEDDDNLESARFVFDSVLLISHETNELRNVHNFVFACISLLESGFQYQFPFRGSLTLTDLFVDEETGLVIGDQFLELRDAERMQDWSGCFVHAQAADLVLRAIAGERGVMDLKSSPNASDAFHWLEVPIKDSFGSLRPLEAWCLNWAYLMEERVIEPGLAYMAKDPAKRDHTAQYLRSVRSLPNDLTPIEGDSVPKQTMIKTIKSRFGFRAAVVDAAGNGVSLPSSKLRFTVVSPDGREQEERTVIFGRAND